MNPKVWSYASVTKRILNIFPEYDTLDVKGKTVLDVGAMDGDSARYFLRRGAKFIHCIEIDPRLAAKINLPNTHVYHKAFAMSDLESIPHDCAKFDIEGYEEPLLQHPPSHYRPTVMQVHGKQLLDKFVNAGWRCIQKEASIGCLSIVVNY